MNVLEAMKHGVVATFQPPRATLMVEGPDARSWLNGVVTCDVAHLHAGRAALGLVLTKQGKILSDVLVIDAPDRLLVGVAAGSEDVVREHLERMLVMEDAELSAISDHAWVALHGGAAPAEAARLAGEVEGVVAGAVDLTGLGGALLVAPASQVDRLRVARLGDGLLQQAVLDPAAYATLRHERGLPEFGVDYDSRHTPHDASLDHRAVSWTKGCYVGQEVVCMQDMRGKVRQRLASVELDDPLPPAPGAVVLAGSGEGVGEVTSGASAADAGHALALARLRSAFSAPGTAVTIAGRPGRVRAIP